MSDNNAAVMSGFHRRLKQSPGVPGGSLNWPAMRGAALSLAERTRELGAFFEGRPFRRAAAEAVVVADQVAMW